MCWLLVSAHSPESRRPFRIGETKRAVLAKAGAHSSTDSYRRDYGGNFSSRDRLCERYSRPLRIETRPLAGAVTFQLAVLAERVRPLEDPVLPRAESAEDFRFHSLRPGEAQTGFQPGQRIGPESVALSEPQSDILFPIDHSPRRGKQTQFRPRHCVKPLADTRIGARQQIRLAEKPGLQPA